MYNIDLTPRGKRVPSVITYFALVFAFSIPFWVAGSLYPVELLPALPASALAAFTPAVAALCLSYSSDRVVGVRQLLRRAFDFQRVPSLTWLLVAVLLNPAVAILAYVIIGAVRGPLPPAAPMTLAIVPLFAFFFLGALGEELGWSGYALEPLYQRWGMLPASLLLGSAWVLWHMVPLMQARRAAGWIAWWSLTTLALRAIMVWLYLQAGRSVFVTVVFHAMTNLCWQLFPVRGSYYDPRVFGLITLSVAFVIYFTQRVLAAGKGQAT